MIYRPTVFETGLGTHHYLEEIRNGTKSWEGPWRPEGDLMRFLQTHYVPTLKNILIFFYQPILKFQVKLVDFV